MNDIDIKKNRKKLNLTQAELAIMIGVSENTIYNYEKGTKIPQSKIAILSKVFHNIDATDLTETTANTAEEPAELYKNIDSEELKTAISTFEEYLKTVNSQLNKLKLAPKTAENIREMKNLTVLQLDLLSDLEELKR